jgi:hypothetical protein
MSAYSVVPASIRHIRPMARCMRSAGAMALEGYGFNPREALRRAFVGSFYARTALVEDRPAAMWGAIGMLMHDKAHMWLVLSNEIHHMPRAIVREARNELASVMEDYRELTAAVLPDDPMAVRFAGFLGFKGSDDPTKDRVPMGDGWAVQLTLRALH